MISKEYQENHHDNPPEKLIFLTAMTFQSMKKKLSFHLWQLSVIAFEPFDTPVEEDVNL